MDVVKLYPQYNTMRERRQTTSPVPFERRSGQDRRSDDRVQLDTNLTRDIFEIKSKVAQIQNSGVKHTQNTASQKEEKISFTENISKAAQNSIKTDQFINSKKSAVQDSPKEIAKSNSKTAALGGVLAVVLGGTIASAFLGVAGAGVALGLGIYFGGKFLKNAIVSHIKNK